MSQTSSSAQSERTPKLTRQNKLWLGGGLALIIALVVSLALTGAFTAKDKTPEAAAPIPVGHTIIVPDNLDGGAAKENVEDVVKDVSAPAYNDPEKLSDYRMVQSDGSVLLKSPLDGECATNAKGNIVPPSNYMHTCYYERNGAIVYTSHAVVGPRTGALENIQYLKVGQVVTLDGVAYKVSKVATYDEEKLPDYLFQKGSVALLTCHLDNSVKSFKDFTKTDIAFLVKK